MNQQELTDGEKAEEVRKRSPRGKIILLGFCGTLLIGLCALALLVLLVSSSPQTGAQGADWLRNLLGNKAVAELEAVVFTMQDNLNQLKFRVEQSTPSAPWDLPALSPSSPVTTGQIGIPKSATPEPGTVATATKVLISADTPSPGGSSTAGVNAASTPTISLPPTSQAWTLTDLAPLGSIPDEGIWMPYIMDANGIPVAYRTFLQPDTERPYVTVGIVAFDLRRSRLHYLPGISEPVSTASLPRTGKIPSSDQQPGFLLAAFNGGFKTVHGNYGVYTDNTVLVPPIDGMGTVAIYSDGSVRIGEWGKDLNFSPDMVSYRQNCPLMVQNGEINPQVYNNSVNDWGGTFSGNIVTFRSGIGISQDSNILYYLAGNTLTMPSLAKSMLVAGAYQAMQLDINNYYVNFVSFTQQDGRLVSVPLLPKEMYENLDRYLNGFGHDFFYVTAVK